MGHIIQTVAVAAVFGLLLLAVAELSPNPSGLSEAAEASLPRSGVRNPVTAVLLNFRSYDTLLEVAVLLAALTALWAVAASPPPMMKAPSVRSVEYLLGWVAPLIAVGGGYLLWVGAKAPGGAFQAGAIWAGGLVLLTLSAQPRVRSMVYRSFSVVGLSVFLFLAVLPLVHGRAFLEFEPTRAGLHILVIEATATLSIALILSALFVGGEPKDG